MKPHHLVLLVLILCSLSGHSVRGGVHEAEYLKGWSETGIISPSLKAKPKAIETERLVSTNSTVQVYERALQSSVLEEDVIKVTTSLHKEDTPRIGDYLDGPIDLPINATTWKDFPCPDAASITPCVCSFDADFNIDLDCTNVESEEQLAAVFTQEFPTKELHGFYMATNDKLKVIGNVLNGITFEYISFLYGPFTFELISDYFLLANKDSLTALAIGSSQMISDAFPFAILVAMEKLNTLHLHSNDLMTWIPKITAPVVTNIIIDNGILDNIEAGTFLIHADGMVVQLHANRIATIEPGSFYFADADNRFSFTLSLHDNLLTTIGEDIFGELFPFITTLSISGNPLLCGCDIAWLVLNPEYMAKIDAGATCADGTNLHELDPVLYGTIC